ncbi:MAG TPA: hypothetical protein VGA26_00860 [Candidatus Limnocylindria bacterium]|jgi:hypothetical protein
MTPIAWLALAIASGAAAYVVGWPALRGRRAREERDLNAERYLAWRGRARPPSASPAPREGLTADERRRLVIAGLLLLLSVAALIAFFATS